MVRGVGLVVVALIVGLNACGDTSSGDTSVLATAVTSVVSVSSAGGGQAGGAGGSDGGAGGMDLGNVTPTCTGLECKVPDCKNKDGTVISGRVYAPNGTLPLYNVVVYMPLFEDQELEKIETGATCEQCPTTISNTYATTLSDSTGQFTLTNMPAGEKLPLVVQVGKWRRKVTLPAIQPCQENLLSDPELTRLPKTKAEGDIPQMAIVTGGCDGLPCLLSKIGLDPTEFTDSLGAGRMHVYKGSGGANVSGGTALAPNTALWNSQQNLMPYDIVMMSCECGEHNETKSVEQKGFMRDYLNSGGRMFATHFHYTWFKNGPPEFAAIAEWEDVSSSNPYKINVGFPKGVAFLKWLDHVSTTFDGMNLNLDDVKDDIGNVSKDATPWIYKPPTGSNGTTVKYFTFNTPVSKPPEEQCGRGVMSDIHVSESSPGTVPSGCNQLPLTDQEKALVFLFFDLSACLTPDDKEPEPPTPK